MGVYAYLYANLCAYVLTKSGGELECLFLSTPSLRQVSQVLELPVFQLCGAPEILLTLSPTMLESQVCVSLHPSILVGAENSP